jgi:hypothetical protein
MTSGGAARCEWISRITQREDMHRMNTRARVTAVPALIAAGAFASLPGILKTAAAQDATPASPVAAAEVPGAWAALGLPEINLTVTDTIQGMPESIEAGRYLLTVTGEAGPDDFAIGAVFMQLPEGLAFEDAMGQAAQSEDQVPAFFYESVFAGGAAALVPAGQTSATAIIDIAPGAGQWIALDPSFTRQPVPFAVTGEMPADLPEPESNATLTTGEMYIEAAEGQLIAGENLVKVTNEGAQPHFIEMMKVPEGTTNDNVAAAIQMEMGATPEAEPLNFEEAMPAAYIADQSAGVTAWTAVTLEAGTYAVTCWIADPETGMPHAMLGMHNVIVVE